MQLFKAEWYRHSKIIAYKIFVLIISLVILGANIYLKMLSPYQDIKVTMLEGIEVFISLCLMGLVLIFPIVISAFSNKSKYIMEQLISSGINYNKIYFTDIILGILISTISFILIMFSAVLFSYLFLGPTEEPLIFGKANYNVWYVYSAILLCIITLVVQAISIQKLIRNTVLSTGTFIFVSYVVAIILIQMKFFSNFAENLSFLFPICDLNYLVVGDITPIKFSLLNLLVMAINVVIIMFFNNLKMRR